MATYIPVPEIFATPSIRAHEPGPEMNDLQEQANHVRSLLDELDRIAPSDRPPALTEEETNQTIEHLGQLARRMMAAVASFAQPRTTEISLGSFEPEGETS